MHCGHALIYQFVSICSESKKLKGILREFYWQNEKYYALDSVLVFQDSIMCGFFLKSSENVTGCPLVI